MGNNDLIKIVIVVVGILFLTGKLGGLGGTGTTGTNTQTNNQVTIPYISTSATTLQFVINDKYNPGTAASGTVWLSRDGSAFKNEGTSSGTGMSASPDQKLEILVVNGTSMRAGYIQSTVVPKAPTMTIKLEMVQNMTPTLRVFNTDNSKMTNGGVAVNQTIIAGGQSNLMVYFDGVDKKETGPMTCVLEANGTAVDKMTLSGNGAKLVGTTKPTFYTTNTSESGIWVYDIDGIVGATTVQVTLGLNMKSGKTCDSGVADNRVFKIACYAKENFIDGTTGKVTFGIQDSDGTAKYSSQAVFAGYCDS